MNAITLHSPWTELISVGAKAIETRHWPAPAGAIGQPLAIHAGKAFHPYAHDFLVESAEAQQAFRDAGISPYTGLAGHFAWDRVEEMDFLAGADPRFLFGQTRGCVLAVATLVGCWSLTGGGREYRVFDPPASGTVRSRHELYSRREIPSSELPFGDYRNGRYAWVLADVVRLPRPIPARGYQAVWQWDAPADVLALVSAGKASAA